MSDLFQRHSQEETLLRIQERLTEGATPPTIIDEMLPKSRDEAMSWGRRLTGWEEYQCAFPAQVISLARIISQRAMREHGLTLRKDGRVVERRAEGKPSKTPRPAASFTLTIKGEDVRVEYTPHYFPNDDTALVYIVSPRNPPQPHPLSDTGYFSRFVSHDVVEANGGPEAYTALLADALLRGQEQSFSEAFEGAFPVTDPRRPRSTNRPTPETGEYAGRLIAEGEKPKTPPHQQRMLF